MREIHDAAKVAVLAGRRDGALALDDQGFALAGQSLNALVDDLVDRYGRVVEQATTANQLEIAQQALKRTKKIASLKQR